MGCLAGGAGFILQRIQAQPTHVPSLHDASRIHQYLPAIAVAITERGTARLPFCMHAALLPHQFTAPHPLHISAGGGWWWATLVLMGQPPCVPTRFCHPASPHARAGGLLKLRLDRPPNAEPKGNMEDPQVRKSKRLGSPEQGCRNRCLVLWPV